jgi:hypothetical protein
MVLTPKCLEISKQMDIYRLAAITFGYDMVVQDRSTRMSGKLQFVSTFNVLPSIYFPLDGNIIQVFAFLFVEDV